jgi:hypothetical protein
MEKPSGQEFWDKKDDHNFQYLVIAEAVNRFFATPGAAIQFIEKLGHEELAEDRQMFADTGDPISPETEKAFFEFYTARRKKSIHQHQEIIENAVRQNELLILISLFEGFLKDVHRSILVTYPRMLSKTRPKRPVDLGRIWGQGINTFIEEEATKEVKEVDHQSLQDKLLYFNDKLG